MQCSVGHINIVRHVKYCGSEQTAADGSSVRVVRYKAIRSISASASSPYCRLPRVDRKPQQPQLHVELEL